MFYQIFLSPKVKRCAIITYKHGVYKLPHKLPNDLKSELQKIFAKLKFSPVMFEKIPSFVCLVLENENKWNLNV